MRSRCFQPLRVRLRVVVGEQHDVPPRGSETEVPGVSRASARTPENPGADQAGQGVGPNRGCAPVVYEDELPIAGGALSGQRRHCAAKGIGAITRWHHDAHARSWAAHRTNVYQLRPKVRCRSIAHIGLNLVFLVPGATGGMEIYARELIPELAAGAPEHRFTAFVNREAAAADGPWRDTVEMVTVPVHAANRVQWVRGEQQLLPPLAQRAGVDLLHSLASTAPAWGRFRRVVTIHDLIYRHVPEAHPGIRSLGMRVLVPLAARRSHRIIVDAVSTTEDVLQLRGVSADKIDVVPLGLGSTSSAPPLSAQAVRAWLSAGERPIVLSVSAKLAHKNLMRLIDAISRFPASTRPLLVLPGYRTSYEEQLRRRADELGVSADVRFLGWVSDSELEGLYAAAGCFVFPSLIEGFGLPVLEAMARGLPVACSGRGAVAEVAGGAALLFDPESETAIAEAIGRLLSDPELAGQLGVAGRARAAEFSWHATALGTLEAYRRTLGNARPPLAA
jgi:glycosyltransferase involved in cell wall biosynthesis